MTSPPTDSDEVVVPPSHPKAPAGAELGPAGAVDGPTPGQKNETRLASGEGTPQVNPSDAEAPSTGLFSPALGWTYLVADLLILIAAKSGPVHFLISIPVAALVYFDCRRRRVPGGGWTLAVAILGGLTFVFYPYRRQRQAPTQDPRPETAVATVTRAAGNAPVQPAAAPGPAFATATAGSGEEPQPSAANAPRERPHLKELSRYLFMSEEMPQPIYRTDGVGSVTTGLKLPGSRNIGSYMARMPFGKVYLYPEYLVFLTESHNPPGEIPTGPKGILLSVLEGWKAIMFWRPVPVARAIWKQMTKTERERLEKPMVNANSIVVPIRDIESIERGRYVLMHYMKIKTPGRELVLGPNAYLTMLSGVFLFFRSVRSSWAACLGIPWERNLEQLLHERVNAQSSAAPAPHTAPDTRPAERSPA